ncbi:MAG: hypothetical protein KDB71_05385 [Mycobacterium sp.]|nr:hypothetical protein [Mycobacterium sp.]
MNSLRRTAGVSVQIAAAIGAAVLFCSAVHADPVATPSPSPLDSDTGIGCLGVCPPWKFPNDTDCVPPASFSQPMCLCSDIPGSPDSETAPC